MPTLRELREVSGLTQLEVATKLEATPGAIYLWEKGKNEPSTRYLIPLAQLFGVTTDDLIRAIEATAALGKAVARRGHATADARRCSEHRRARGSVT